MKADAAVQISRDWMDMLNARWDMFAPGQPAAMSYQERLAAVLARHLEHTAPDGAAFIVRNAHDAANVAVVIGNGLCVTRVSAHNPEEERIAYFSEFHRFADAQGASVEIGYNALSGGGHCEDWVFRFADNTVEIQTFSEEDRALPRRIAAAIGWPVPERTS